MEGVEVSPAAFGEEELLDDGIEVLPEDMPPPPPESVSEDEAGGPQTVLGMPAVTSEDIESDGEVSDYMTEVPEESIDVETPPVPPEALENGENEEYPPEAEEATIELESIDRMAPFEKLEGIPTGAPPPPSETAPIRTFVLLFSLFVVVGGAAVLLYMKFSGPMEAGRVPPPPQIKAVAPSPPVPKPPAPKPPDPVAVPVVKDAVTSPDKPDVASASSEAATAEVPPPVPEPEPPQRSLADKLRCPAGMAKVVLDAEAEDSPAIDTGKVAFCMDAYEYPGMGKKPKTKVSKSSARSLCKKGGKALCTVAQWNAACSATYPYGKEYKEGACNVEGAIKESGSFPDCVTSSGIYDLVGNASEWASDKRLHGGDTAGGPANVCGSSSKRFMPGPTNGFRCCAAAGR